MVKTPFIWLGAGRAQKRGVARRGVLLDKVARANLPVPQGAILLDELLRIYLHEGIVEWAGNTVVVPDPVWLMEVLYRDVRFPHLKTTADVQPVLSDTYQGSRPDGALVSDVDLESASELAAALRHAWSFQAPGDEFRRDVLLTRYLAAETTGKATLSAEKDGDIITPAASQTDGKDGSFSLPQLGAWQRPSTDVPAQVGRLQMLLRGVRRTLGKGAWDVNWIDDGQVCWIVGFN